MKDFLGKIAFFFVLLVVVVLARFWGESAGRSDALNYLTATATEDPAAYLRTVDVEISQFLSEIERFRKTNALRASHTKAEYSEKMKEIGFDSLLDMRRLERDPDFTESMAIINGAESAFQAYQARLLSDEEETRNEILRLKISKEERNAMLSSYNAAAEKNRKFLDLEKTVFPECRSIMELLSSSRGGWVVGDGAISYSDENLRSEVHSHLQALARIVESQRLLQIDMQNPAH